MNAPSDTALFYATVPVQRGFRSLMDPAQYTPLPDDWTVGMADIVQSTKAIAEKRYKAVNMAGAAVIAALTNALEGREFPFVFGGDGASFAVSPREADTARARRWRRRRPGRIRELGLTLRVALIPVAAIRAQGHDVRRGALCAVGESVLRDVFRRRARLGRRRDEARRHSPCAPAPPGTWPDLTGLSCRFQEIRADAGCDALTDRAANVRRRSGGLPRAHRGDRGAGRSQSRCRAAGAGPRAKARLAAARRRA